MGKIWRPHEKYHQTPKIASPAKERLLVKRKIGRIGVLMGGPSTEREISLKSGRAVYQALKEQGLEVVPLDIRSNPLKVSLKR